MDSEMEDPEVGALIEEGLREAQADARAAEERVVELRRDLEQAEQRAQQSRARVRKLTGFSIEPFLAPPWLRPRDLKEAKAQIPRGSIQCAQWDDEGPNTQRVRLGLQLGDDGPGFWVEVARADLGTFGAPHMKGESNVELAARLSDERDEAVRQLQLEVDRHSRVSEAARIVLTKLEAVANAPFAYAADALREATRILREVLP